MMFWLHTCIWNCRCHTFTLNKSLKPYPHQTTLKKIWLVQNVLWLVVWNIHSQSCLSPISTNQANLFTLKKVSKMLDELLLSWFFFYGIQRLNHIVYTLGFGSRWGARQEKSLNFTKCPKSNLAQKDFSLCRSCPGCKSPNQCCIVTFLLLYRYFRVHRSLPSYHLFCGLDVGLWPLVDVSGVLRPLLHWFGLCSKSYLREAS